MSSPSTTTMLSCANSGAVDAPSVDTAPLVPRNLLRRLLSNLSGVVKPAHQLPLFSKTQRHQNVLY